MSDISVRRMLPSDLDAVITLGETTQEIQTGSTLAQFYDKTALSEWLKLPHSILLVAEYKGQFAGFRLADYNPGNKVAYLEMIAVHPSFRERGVWTALYNETLQILKSLGCTQVWCIVREDNHLMQKLLTKKGFSAGVLFRSYEKDIV